MVEVACAADGETMSAGGHVAQRCARIEELNTVHFESVNGDVRVAKVDATNLRRSFVDLRHGLEQLRTRTLRLVAESGYQLVDSHLNGSVITPVR